MPSDMQSSLIFHYNLKLYDSDKDVFDNVSLKRFVMQVRETLIKTFIYRFTNKIQIHDGSHHPLHHNITLHTNFTQKSTRLQTQNVHHIEHYSLLVKTDTSKTFDAGPISLMSHTLQPIHAAQHPNSINQCIHLICRRLMNPIHTHTHM